jgi:hypothetical protein
MNGNKSVTANFGLKAPELTVPAQSTGSVTLSWTYEWPCGSGICLGSSNDRYEVEESMSSVGPFSVVSTFGRSTSTTTLTKGAGTYYYRVRAFTTFGYSQYSIVKSVSVIAPSEITVNASATNGLVFRMNDPSLETRVFRDGLTVGCEYTVTFTDAGPVTDRTCFSSALRFDALQSQIDGRTVARATLKLYPSILPGDWNTSYAVNAFVGPWDPSTITFKNEPNYWPTAQAVVAPPTTTAVALEFDVTAIVSRWANHTWSNYGLLVRDVNAAGADPLAILKRETWFETLTTYTSLSRRPQLTITFQ